MEQKRGKSLIINTFVLSMGQFFPQIAAIITLPIYTGYLTKAEYGRYDLVNVLVYILNVVVILQIHQAAFRFLIDVRGKKEEKVYITNTIAFEIIPSIFSSIVFGLAYYTLPASTRILLGLYLFFNLQFNISGQIARGLGKNSVYAIGAIAHSLSNLILVVILVSKIQLGFNGLFIALDSSLLIGTAIQIIACKQWKKIDLSTLDKNVLKEMIGYSWPMVPNTLSIWIVNTCDKFIIRFLLGLEFNGIFAAAQKIPNIFTMAYSTFNLAWQESASITVTDTDYNRYYNEVFSALFDFLTGCMLLLIAASPVLFKILIRGNYELAYDQMPLLYIGVFLSCISSYFGSIYIAKKATKAVGISSAIGAVINAVVNLSMVHWAGLYAASVSTIVSYLVLVVYRTRDVEKKDFVHIDYKKGHILICLSLIVLCSVLCYLKVGILNWINLGIGIIGFFALNHKLLKQVLNGVTNKLKGSRT